MHRINFSVGKESDFGYPGVNFTAKGYISIGIKNIGVALDLTACLLISSKKHYKVKVTCLDSGLLRILGKSFNLYVLQFSVFKMGLLSYIPHGIVVRVK